MNETIFEMRELKSKDIVPMTTIMSKIGLKEIKNSFNPDVVKEVMKSFNGEGDVSNYVGISIMTDALDIIMKNLPKVESDLFAFLASLTGKTTQEIEDLSLVVFTELVVQVIQKDEFKDFFKVVSRLFNQMN